MEERMMMQGGARRAEAARGRLGDSIFSWERCSWADSATVFMLWINRGAFSPPFPWVWGGEGFLAKTKQEPSLQPRSSSPAGRCSPASPRLVPFPWAGAEGGLGPCKEEFLI